MLDSGYYIAVVKEEVETDADNKVGVSKTKTMTYNYIVKAGSVGSAYQKVEDYMQSCMNTWRIHSVKEYKLTDIIE